MIRRLVALAGVLCVGLAGCSSGNPRASTPTTRPGGEPVRVPTLPTARDDALVLDDGVSDIVAVDPNARVIGVRRVVIAESFHVAFLVDRTLVLAADDATVRGVALAGGPVRVFGSGLPVIGTQAGTMWITGEVPRMRLVDAAGRVLLEKPGPPGPRRGACRNCPSLAVAAVPGALVFQTPSGFDIWGTTSGRRTGHLGSQPSRAGPVFGSTLPWCTHCERALELTDFASGKTREVGLSIAGTADALLSARWSPDGARLAIPEAVGPGRTANVILVDVASGRASQLPTAGHTASVAWSRDGQRLYIASSNGLRTRLTVRNVAAGTSRDLATIPGPALHLAATISKGEAAYLLGGARSSPRTCVLRRTLPNAATAGCSYGY